MQERQETKTFSFKYSRVYFTTHMSFYHDLRITFGRWALISFEMAQCLRIMNRIHVTGILKRLNAWKYKLWRKLAHKQIFIFKSLAMALRPNQFSHQRREGYIWKGKDTSGNILDLFLFSFTCWDSFIAYVSLFRCFLNN